MNKYNKQFFFHIVITNRVIAIHTILIIENRVYSNASYRGITVFVKTEVLSAT